ELNRIAPGMKLLAMESTNLNSEETYRVVNKWLNEYGDEIRGIVSADDNLVQIGINKALAEAGREDIIRVANGSTQTGIRMLKDGNLDAITFQSAELDGALPIQVAVDWFNNLIVPTIKYLPTHILTRENVEEFVFNYNNPGEINLDYLYKLIIECNSREVESFFNSLNIQFSSMGVLTLEYFRGFSIELLSNLINIIKSSKLSEKRIIVDYETIFKKLFNQQTTERSLYWLKDVSLKIIYSIEETRQKPVTLIQQIVDHVNSEFMNPLSIKVISYSFNISAAYLGKLFKQETGESFSRYLNNLRIEKAKALLLSTNIKANKIALEVGYSDSNYFYNIFKKYAGMYPSEYL
ncbi:MAG: helix-turn-helix domain-containing protein, partial [Spirochaetales bacterium]|nr:helix-turn-helix domain-containing protein [Spirochaetales bacterium]